MMRPKQYAFFLLRPIMMLDEPSVVQITAIFNEIFFALLNSLNSYFKKETFLFTNNIFYKLKQKE